MDGGNGGGVVGANCLQTHRHRRRLGRALVIVSSSSISRTVLKVVEILILAQAHLFDDHSFAPPLERFHELLHKGLLVFFAQVAPALGTHPRVLDSLFGQITVVFNS